MSSYPEVIPKRAPYSDRVYAIALILYGGSAALSLYALIWFFWAVI